MRKILLIDDEKMCVELMDDILKTLGYSPTTAESGREGLNRFQDDHFDLVITDLSMAGMDGFEVAEHIRSSERPDTPILCVTGGITLNKVKIFDQVMKKPFTIQELKNTVERIFTAHPREI